MSIKAVRLVFVRSTTTNDHEQEIYSGQNDVLLNAKGISQTVDIANRMGVYDNIRLILTSDLMRAKQLAQSIKLENPCSFIFETPLLHEVNMGSMTGMSKTDLLEGYPKRHHHPEKFDYDFRDVGGECANDVYKRYRYVLRHYIRPFVEKAEGSLVYVILVGHSIALRTTFVEHLMKVPHLHKVGDFQDCLWRLD